MCFASGTIIGIVAALMLPRPLLAIAVIIAGLVSIGGAARNATRGNPK